VQFANQTDAYAPLKRLLSEYGVTTQLSGKAGKLHYQAGLTNIGVGENDKVMFLAGSSYFSIR